MPQNKENLMRIAAARHGLRLIKRRDGLIGSAHTEYCLRLMWDASQIVGLRADGAIGLVKTTSKGDRRREKVASWLQLHAVERVLENWQ